jgi:hypothetical protein
VDTKFKSALNLSEIGKKSKKNMGELRRKKELEE